MQLGMIGLGRMGGNIVRRLMKHGHSAVVYDKDAKAVAALAAEGARGRVAEDLSKLERRARLGDAAGEEGIELTQGWRVVSSSTGQQLVGRRRGQALKERGCICDVAPAGVKKKKKKKRL